MLSGGYDGSPMNAVYEFDWNNGIFIAKKSMITCKYYHSLCSLKSIIYAIGGCDKEKSIQDAELYDITTDTWK